MAFFSVYQDTLPNPSNSIAYDGSASANTGSAAGPGYASVKISSNFKTMRDRTNSGRLISRSKAAQNFSISISYNPLTEEEFTPIYSFLMEKQGMLKPFFVPLPQYDNPQDSTFASGGFTFTIPTLTSAASPQILVQSTNTSPDYNSGTDGTLRPGDLITFSDPNNSNHLKAYKIVRVETNANYLTGTQPATNQLRLTVSPPLQRAVSNQATMIYTNPRVKVVMKNDVSAYDLKNDNLYQFSLNMEEVQ